MTSPTPNLGTKTTYATGGSTTSHPVTAPSDAANKAVYIAAVLDGTGDLSSGGFTAILDNIPIPSSGETANLALFRKAEGASPPATYTVTSTNSERMAGLCWTQNGDNGLDPGKTSTAEGNSGTATAVSVTPSEDSTMAILFVGTEAETVPHTGPSGWTAIGEVNYLSGGSLSVYYKLLPTAVATGTPAVTLNSSKQWVAGVAIIKGDGAGPGGGHAGQLVNGLILKSKTRGLTA